MYQNLSLWTKFNLLGSSLFASVLIVGDFVFIFCVFLVCLLCFVGDLILATRKLQWENMLLLFIVFWCLLYLLLVCYIFLFFVCSCLLCFLVFFVCSCFCIFLFFCVFFFVVFSGLLCFLVDFMVARHKCSNGKSFLFLPPGSW